MANELESTPLSAEGRARYVSLLHELRERTAWFTPYRKPERAAELQRVITTMAAPDDATKEDLRQVLLALKAISAEARSSLAWLFTEGTDDRG